MCASCVSSDTQPLNSSRLVYVFTNTSSYTQGTVDYTRLHGLRYNIAPTQLNLTASSQLLPGKIAYGKNGIIEGDDSINNKVIGLFNLHHNYGYDFDMALTFKANVRKKYDYELENNEKFITEARTYYKMDQDYDGMLFINDSIVIGEYMEDGYSKNINEIFKKYPYGYFEYFKECLSYVNKGTKFKKRLYFIKHYILFGYLTHRKMSECIKYVTGFNKILVMLLVIPGYIKSSKF